MYKVLVAFLGKSVGQSHGRVAWKASGDSREKEVTGSQSDVRPGQTW